MVTDKQELDNTAGRAAVSRRGISGSESVPSTSGADAACLREYTGSGMVRTLIAALAVVTAPAAADTLYEEQGVSLEGTVRLVGRDAATCQVLEEIESPETYEATRANHGRPLHVWRLDYGALNASGKALSNLTAHFQIEAEWPPCTNWTGLGQYPGPVQWAGSFETLQRTGGLAAGGEARETLYVLAIDGRRPRFSRWQLAFRFGEVTGTAAEPKTELPPAPPSEPALPEPRCEGLKRGTPCWQELDNQRGCYVWGFQLFDGKWTWEGKCADGRAIGPGTLRNTWAWYTGGRGWFEDTGEMQDGKQHGRWVGHGSQGSAEGKYVDGERQGPWIERYDAAENPDGHYVEEDQYLYGHYVEEGEYVDGKRNGRWVFRWRTGGGGAGDYVRGEKHGEWVIRYPDGRVSRPRYVHGEYQR